MKLMRSILVISAVGLLCSTALLPMKKKHSGHGPLTKMSKKRSCRKLSRSPKSRDLKDLFGENGVDFKKLEAESGQVPASIPRKRSYSHPPLHGESYTQKLSSASEPLYETRLLAAIKNNQKATVIGLLRKPDITPIADKVKNNIAKEHFWVLNAASQDPEHTWHILCNFLKLISDIEYAETIKAQGWTILHELAKLGYFDPLASILEKNVSPNIASEMRSTPLHVAVAHGRYLLVKLLLENNANPNARDDKNQTPLMIANKLKLNHLLKPTKQAQYEKIAKLLRWHTEEALPKLFSCGQEARKNRLAQRRWGKIGAE